MTKKSFSFLILTVAGVLVFGMGLCMCLLPEWNAFGPGVVVTALGLLALLVIGLIRWLMAGRPVPQINWKVVGKAAYGVISALVLGTGMCMVLVFDGLMIPGIIVGIAGILMLLGLIPLLGGLR